ncbi:MAG: hypothetical protein CMA12_04755 [Euryarchaeota archaeon]|nr:hypothetical protein [Euryarchaeota archaeon]
MYRLIWFQHIHKAAGTLVVNLAKSNGEILYKNNANGNPLDEHNERIELWKYDEAQLKSFVDICEEDGVTFVATEHGSPDFEVLHRDSRVVLLTTLRDPHARAISNYNHAYFGGYTKASKIDDFLSERRFFMSDNFYVRTFSRKEQLPLESISEEDLKIAGDTLALFDLVILLGKNDVLTTLSEEFEWDISYVDSHATFGDPWKVWNMMKKGRFIRVLRYLRGLSAPGDQALLDGRYDLDLSLMRSLEGDSV